MTTKTKPKVTMPGRKAPPESAVRALEAAAEARQNRPAKGDDSASSQSRTTAKPQASAAPVTPSPEAEGRAVVRKRGAWTKETPYTRKDGTATRGTTVYLPVELAERLRRYAFERDTKQNAIMTEAIAAYLDERGA